MAEGGGLLNRYTLVKAYRGFESLRLRHSMISLRRFPKFDTRRDGTWLLRSSGAVVVAFSGCGVKTAISSTG